MKKNLTLLLLTVLCASSLQASLFFYDALNYANGNITTNSSGRWLRHSGTGNDSLVVNNRYEVNQNRADDVHRWFDPINTNTVSSGTVYASFMMRMTNLPNAAGVYFAHLM